MALADTLQSMQEFDLADLDFDSIGSWPTAIKVILVLLLMVALIFGGYYYLIADMEISLENERKQEVSLKQRFERKAHEAANLEDYRAQIKEIEAKFGVLLKQLPGDTEVPGLLDDISDTGVSNGVRFTSIGLKNEAKREFYVELPIEIDVDGTYHDFGAFVSGVAALPRIVTLHNFKISAGKGGELKMNILAKTYRYRE